MYMGKDASEDDPRVTRTRKSLRGALEQECRENPSGRITVSSLCDRAGISRKAFYTHYADLDELVADCFEHHWLFRDSYADLDDADVERVTLRHLDLTYEALAYLKANPRIARMALDGIATSPYYRDVFDSHVNVLVDYARDRPGDDAVKASRAPVTSRECTVFATHGFIGYVRDWVGHGMAEPIEDVTRALGFMTSHALCAQARTTVPDGELAVILGWKPRAS